VGKGKSSAGRRPKVAKSVTPNLAKAKGVLALETVQVTTCKISSGFQIKAPDMPVTINLCKDTQGTLATEVQFAAVTVFDNSGNLVANQPTNLKSNSFDLNLPPGAYDINSTVAPASGASSTSKPTVFLYEACRNPTIQLCAFVTSTSPGGSFSLGVIS
jgi:hypothetical protein